MHERPESTSDTPYALLVETDSFWVFGYGSLMWSPGFPFIEQRHATLPGFHRRFCIRSVLYRGTPEQPGLVLGVDAGGECQGMAFRVDAAHREEVLKYLYERELRLNVYTPQWVSIVSGGATFEALTFVVNRDHDQFVYLSEEEMAGIIVCCAGAWGSNFEYLENTVRALHELGVPDPELDALFVRVCALRSNQPPGPAAIAASG
ncbi:MAG: gamma-glutamylcyclotransferase [Betaproteobacteria bacterium]